MQIAQNALLDKAWIELLPMAGTVAGLMLLTRCMTPAQLHKSLKWDIYLTIACAIGISKALENSGVAKMIATGIVDLGTHADPVFVHCSSIVTFQPQDTGKFGGHIHHLYKTREL